MKNLPMVGLRSAALLLVAAQFSCGGSSDPVAPPVATTLTANSSANLSGTAGTAVATPPSVLVRDQRGDPMSGVPVAFNVSSGGGSVVGSAAMTNSSGVAAVTSWTLGTTVGTNTMVASTGSLTPITFTATSVAGAAASITKTAGDSQSAPAGTAVAIPPSVTVKDANGNLVVGASVTFSVTAGGGSVTGGSQTTNSSGVATVGGWTLGASAVANSLSEPVGSLTPAVFTATGTAGAAASITKTAGDNQSATNGTAVAVPPAVTVRDANGNPVAGVTVIFAVASGGGSLTGGTQVTNASGVATVGSWTLGAAAGTNTLTATAGSLPSVTFTATAVLSPLCAPANWPSHTIGTTTSGALTTDDCLRSSGRYMDFYITTVSPAGAYAFDESSTAFDSYLYLYGPDGFVVGYNDDGSTGLDSHLKVLVPSAAYVLGATSFDPGSTGSYTVSSSTTAAAITGCEEVFVARGITTSQTLETTDCLRTGFYSDDVVIFLRAGTTVTISMNSTAIDAALQLYSRNGLEVSNDDKDATTNDAQVSFTAQVDDFYLIVPTSSVAGAIGAYTLIIQ
jgi:hypothetical protein